MIAIIDYGAGNITSVRNCLRTLGVNTVLTRDPNVIELADKVIFPGVGEASYAMNRIKDLKLDKVIQNLTQPLLGICLGAQILCEHSEEGNIAGLGVFKTTVKKFDEADDLKFPHMGWNNHDKMESHPILEGLSLNSDFYFVHGYYIEPNADAIAVLNYGNLAASVLVKDNFYATQFHPEKSGENGKKIIQNFLKL
jgi:imidazole glycerol-phosphate synthase subunit HisH